MNVAPLALSAPVTRRSHWGQRSAAVVWSHVRSASDSYAIPHSVLMGLGEVSDTACHSAVQWPRCRSEAHRLRRGISGTARYLMAWTPPTPDPPEIVVLRVPED